MQIELINNMKPHVNFARSVWGALLCVIPVCVELVEKSRALEVVIPAACCSNVKEELQKTANLNAYCPSI